MPAYFARRSSNSERVRCVVCISGAREGVNFITDATYGCSGDDDDDQGGWRVGGSCLDDYLGMNVIFDIILALFQQLSSH